MAKLTPGLRFAAENAGKADALRAEQAVYFGKDAELVKDGMLKKANLRSKDRRMLDAIAKNAGIKVRMVDKLVDERGYAADAQYKDGELLISLNAGDPVRAAFTHDLVHRIRVVSPEAYTTLASFVRDNMSRDNWNALVKGEASRYGEKGMDYLSEEMVADAFGKLMGDSALLDQFVKEDRQAWQIVLDAIKDMIAAIKRALNGQNVKLTAEQKADFAELQANLEGMSKALEKALKQMEADVKHNTKEGNKNTASEGGEVKYALRAFLDGVRFVDVQTDQAQFDGLSDKEKTKKAIQIIKQRFAGKIVGIDNPVFVNGRTAAEYGYPVKNIDSDIRDAKMKASTELDNLMDAGTNFRTEPDGRDGHVHPDAVDDFQYYDVIFKVGNEYYKGVINIEIVAKGRLLKDITKIENITQDISSSYGENPKSTFLRDTSMNSIRKDSEKSNTQNSESKNSLTLASDPSTTGLIRENTRLKEQVEKWKGQTKRTTTPTLRQGDVDKLTRQIVKDYDGTLDWHDIVGDVKALGEFILRGGEELTWSEVKERAMDIGRKIVNSAQVLVDGELEQDLNGLKGYLRNTTLAYEDNGDIPDFNDWRKRHFGKFNISKDGLPVDVAYQELQEAFGEVYFPADITHPSDQLMHIAQLLDDMQSVMENPYSADMEQAIQHAANALIDGLLSEQVRQSPPTFADKQAAKLDGVKAKSRESTKRQLDRVRADRDAKLEQLKEKHRAKDKAGRERQNAGELRRKIQKHVKKLSGELLRPSDKHHIPEALREPVARLLAAIDLESTYALEYGTDAKYHRVEKGTPGAEDTGRTKAFADLKKAYTEIAGDLVIDPDLLGDGGLFDEMIGLAGKPIAAMNAQELQTVWDTVRAVEQSIRTANKMFAAELFATVKEAAHALHAENRGKLPARNGIDLLTLDMMTPETYFHLLGETGDKLFRMLRTAQDKKTSLQKQVADFTHNALGKLDVQGLEREKHAVTLGGEQVTLTTAQLMELYVLMRRQQAADHILTGGILPETSGWSLGRNRPEPIRGITMQELADAFSLLSAEQVQIAERLQGFASTTLSDFGNAASMAVYNYKKFTEANYWPIRTNRQEIKSTTEKDTQVTSVANKGFTKGTKPNASTSVRLGSVFDTFTEHTGDMVDYAAWLPAMEDINRIRNYTQRNEGGTPFWTVKGLMDRVHGKNGSAYLEKLMADISVGIQGEKLYTGKLMGNFKASAVAHNLQVMIQQTTAVLRALDMISAKHMATIKNPLDGWKKALKYAPIAQWKEWGSFDTNTGRTLKDILFENGSVFEKGRQFGMVGAGFMDSIGWGHLWNAVEAEVRAEMSKAHQAQEQPDSEDFYKLVAERFTEVIDHTQVVDGVLQRSQIMRRSDALNRMATAFMGEPTKQYNMLMASVYDAVKEQEPQARNKARRKLARTIFAVSSSIVANAAAKALTQAERDDDDREKEYWEKWFENFRDNILDAANPVGYVPYAKDLVSLVQGYDVARMDIDGVADFVNAARQAIKSIGGEGKKAPAGALAELFATGGDLLGLGARGFKREVRSALMFVATETKNYRLQYEIDKFTLNMQANKSVFYKTLYAASKTDKDAFRVIYNDMIKNGIPRDDIEAALKRLKKAEQAK